MSSTSTVWVDLTHMLQWEGRFTGVERVEYQIATHYAKEGGRFFAYNQVHRAYYEMPVETLDIFKDGFGGMRTESAVIGNRTPLQRMLPYAKKLLPTSARKAVKARLLKENSSASATRLLPQQPFQKGDTVLIGATFSDIAFLEHLTELRGRVGFKLAHIVHDIVPIVCPQVVHDWDTQHFLTYYGLLVQHADLLLCVSKSSERDIIAFARSQKVPTLKTAVIRLGDDFHHVTHPTRPKGVKKGEEYIICVGTFEVRKNHTLLYYAYKQGLREGKKLPNLVIVGRDGWQTENIRRILATDPEVQGKIKVLNKVDASAEMTWLFQNSLFAIQPSFYEGWGIPIAEAVYYGKVCLSSDTSSMTEIAGDLNDYFSPFNSQQCLEKIVQYSSNRKLLAAKEQKLQKQYKPTTWDDTFAMVRDAVNT
jgi:glycosyltransferase involved in cell wall biosynthesis